MLYRAFCYIDDLAIFSQDWKTHMEHLRQVFTTLKDAKLTLKNDKCLLGADYCDILGHTIGGGKIQPMKAKVQVIESERSEHTVVLSSRFYYIYIV